MHVNKLKINLIFFYENITEENVFLYNRLKLEVQGGFFGVIDVDVLIKLLSKIEALNSPFILISTGSSFQKINYICNRFACIKNIIIYCLEVEKYKFLFQNNKSVNLISNRIYEINEYLDEISLEEDYDKNIKNLINYNPLISIYEYENYYYIYHEILSFFSKKIFQN